MKRKKKGRRIYTYHARNRRVFSPYHPMRTAVSAVFTLVAVAVLVFVGYNVVGPVVTRMEVEAETPTTVPDPFFAETTNIPEQTTVPHVPSADTTSSYVTTQTELTTTTTTTTEMVLPTVTRFVEGATVIRFAEADAMDDLAALDAAVDTFAAEGYHALVLEMKQNGGQLRYASNVKRALNCGASNPDMLSLREIQNAAGRKNMTCVASMSTLADHIYSNYSVDGCYTFQGSATRWLDNKVEKGGKPWLNPKADGAKQYLSELAKEMTEGGFSLVLCEDLVYPEFFRSDSEHLGKWINDPKQRKEALISLLNAIGKAEPNACAHFDMAKAVNGEEPVCDVQKLTIPNICLDIDVDAFTTSFTIGEQRFDPSSLSFQDKLPLLLQAAEELTGNLKLYPCIVSNELKDDELEEAVALTYAAGYDTIFVKN